MKLLIYIFFIIQTSLCVAGPGLSEDQIKEIRKETKNLLIGSIQNFQRTFYTIDKMGKKVSVDFKEVIEYQNKMINDPKDVKLKEYHFHTVAFLYVTKVLKGDDYKSSSCIAIEWDDGIGSMCPHASSFLRVGEKATWYSSKEHTKEKPQLKPILPKDSIFFPPEPPEPPIPNEK